MAGFHFFDVIRWAKICDNFGCPDGYDKKADSYQDDFDAAQRAAEESEPLAMQIIAAYITERLSE